MKRQLRSLAVRGAGREKIALLLREIVTLKIETHPHAFCFLLRSMFELSAKAYCADHRRAGGPNDKKPDGNDKHLVDLLRDIVMHLTANGTDKERERRLHGAMTELANKHSVLSVTSLNQLVHNPRFSVAPGNICILFGNVFPLLVEMNA